MRRALARVSLLAVVVVCAAAAAPVEFDNLKVDGATSVRFDRSEVVCTGPELHIQFPGAEVRAREVRVQLRQSRVATAEARGAVRLDLTLRTTDGDPMALRGLGETLTYDAAGEQATLRGAAVTVTLRDAAGGVFEGTGAAWIRVDLAQGQFQGFEAQAPEGRVMQWRYTAPAEEEPGAPGR